MKIVVNNKVIEKNEPFTLESLAKEVGAECYCAAVDNRIRELGYIVKTDCEVNFLDLTNSDAVTVYHTSLRYLICMAVKNLYPTAKVTINFSISRAYEVQLEGVALTKKVLDKIEEEMRRIVSENYPIKRKSVTKEEAKKYYLENGYAVKAEILEYRPEETVHFYECNGFLNYMFGYMVPSTGYLNKFILRLYGHGFICQYPRSEAKGEIPEFEDAPTFAKALADDINWGKICGGSYIHQINKSIEELKELELVNLCETKHNDSLAELGLKIKSDIENIRLIAVAGPSSSGKTTFTNRLRIELMSRGITPLMISLDNYYLSKDKAPKDEFGNPDLEHINALDVEFFNDQMFALISGEEVTLPIFNFETGKREWGETVKLGPNNPVMIEGIHALNDDLTPSIPLHNKFKIYIAPQSQLHIDEENPISISELRLLRRLVRDYKFRNAKAIETLEMWASVRRGEFKWIYPYQEGADYVYNSELTYELAVLKKYALPLLEEIDKDSPYFIQANRICKFLKYFKDIPDDWIPCNSVLREFIGGSSFYRK